MRKEKLWNRGFILAFAVILLTGFAMNMMNSTMAKYIYSIYGNATFSGVLNAVFAVMAILARLIAGDLSDRKGRAVVMTMGCAIFAAAVFGFGLFPWAAALVIFRGLQGFGYASSSTGAYAAGSDMTPEDRMGEGIGYLSLGYSLAMAVGPAIALKLICGDDYRPVFFTAGVLLLAAIVIAAVFGRTEEKARPAVSRVKVPLKERFLEKTALPAASAQLLNCLAQAAINSYIVIFADSKGITGSAGFFTFMAVSMCVTRALVGSAGDRYGFRKVTAAAVAANIIGFAMLLAFPSVAAFYGAGILLGVGQGIFGPCMQAVAVQSASQERRGSANSTFQLSNDLSNGLGAVIWGIVIDGLGYGAMLMGCILSSAASLVLVFTVVSKRTKS